MEIERSALPYDEACILCDFRCDVVQVITSKCDATFGRISRPAPLVDEDCRAFMRGRVGPVPIG